MSSDDARWPAAYLITFRTYGTWLPGSERGSVDRNHRGYGQRYHDPDLAFELVAGGRMRQPAVILTQDQRDAVEHAIREVCLHRGWELLQVAVRSNHVHVVVSAPEVPERVMNAFKSWSTRGLRTGGASSETEGKTWARHGSTRYLWDEDSIAEARRYVAEGQDGERFGDSSSA